MHIRDKFKEYFSTRALQDQAYLETPNMIREVPKVSIEPTPRSEFEASRNLTSKAEVDLQLKRAKALLERKAVV